MRTHLAGVIGWPVSHSLSPRLHGYWLAAHKIAGAYVKMPVQREHFAQVIECLMHAGFAGVNVTVPHKEAAFALASSCDGLARATQAANLLIFQENGGVRACNTDVFGLRRSLESELGFATLKNQHAVIVGAGGAARAAVMALGELEAAEITVINRSPARAETLLTTLRPHLKTPLSLASPNQWPNLAGSVDLLINCTSIGLGEQTAFMLDLAQLPPAARICDMVYRRGGTLLVQTARRLGLSAIDGLGMLMYQAVPSFGAFYGVTPDVTPALRHHLESETP
jgi:shikimate dehydrogenase